MVHAAELSSLSPAVLAHLVAASAALVLGPYALWVRKGTPAHRAAGYAWVALMLAAAVSALFIRDFRMANVAGFTPIHLLVLLTFAGVGRAIWYVAKGRIALHRQMMWRTYLGACVGAGLFALLPGRYLGDLVWHHALALV